jgi:hypothetical protein
MLARAFTARTGLDVSCAREVLMNREPDEKIVENPRHDEEATGTVLRLVPRAEREPKATRTGGEAGRTSCRSPRRTATMTTPGPAPPKPCKTTTF